MPASIVCSSGIYAITNSVNGKKYIGSAVRLHYRFKEHVRLLNKGIHHSITLQRSWDKYGQDAFSYSVLEFVPVRDLLIAREQFWIDSLSSTGKRGFNVSPTAGSPMGVKHSAEARKNMSEAHKGKTLPDEQKLKIGMAGRGRKMSPESVAKRNASRIANGGFRQSPESYEKMVQTRRARGGFSHTEEAREKMREGGRKRWANATLRMQTN